MAYGPGERYWVGLLFIHGGGGGRGSSNKGFISDFGTLLVIFGFMWQADLDIILSYLAAFQ